MNVVLLDPEELNLQYVSKVGCFIPNDSFSLNKNMFIVHRTSSTVKERKQR